MANKQLTVKVRLNTTQAEQSINRLVKKINQIDNAVNKTNRATSATNQVVKSTSRWASEQKKVNTLLRSSNSSLGLIRSKLKGIASTYLGIMGMKAVIGTSDKITSAENKLNYVHGGNTGMTQASMDQMYASSQKVRMGYTDMMSNVSKSMALAGDAFDNNTNKAIRFQEIMAEAYAVGGASAQEMSSSMYQLMQALGSGILAGDELRSVREGAPLAYKEIEKFAQGVYDCSDSLKDMASDGMITSEMVVAAIMNAGDKMDSAFAQTEQTFAQTWEQIKNVGVKSFEPVAKMLRKGLNDAIDSGLIGKVEVVFSNIAKGIMITFTVIKKAVTWIADNWDWLKHVVIGVITVMISAYIILGLISVQSAIASAIAWLSANAAMLPTLFTIGAIILGVFALIYIFYLWKTAAINTADVIIIALFAIATALIVIGWIINSGTMIWVGIVLLVVGIVASVSSNLCDFLYNLAMVLCIAIVGFLLIVLAVYIATGVVMLSIPMLIGLMIVAVVALLLALFFKFTSQVCGIAYGIWAVIKAIVEWISIAWDNMCAAMGYSFWSAIADMLDGCEWLLKGINKIREALGKDTISIEGIRAKADEYKNKGGKELPNIGEAWNKGYAEGSAIGNGIHDKINGFGDKISNLGSQYQNPNGSTSDLLDGLGNKLGLNFDDFSNFPDFNDPAYDLSNLDDIGKGVGKTADNTDKIADELDLTKEDLEYLRKVAEMEWKKEFTTANITVDMTNNNTINGESDLDGIVTHLSEKLYEELNIVANGVYAY